MVCFNGSDFSNRFLFAVNNILVYFVDFLFSEMKFVAFTNIEFVGLFVWLFVFGLIFRG